MTAAASRRRRARVAAALHAPRTWIALIALIALIAPWAGGCARAPREPAPRRLLVVGWDGATWRAIDPLLAAGRMPHLSRLLHDGFSARLESTIVPVSSAAWCAAVTGKTPGKTGVLTFLEPVEGTHRARLVTSRSNRATPIWRTLTRRGLASVVFGVPLTYPPEPIRGVLVAGMLSPADAVYTWPPELSDALRRRGLLPDIGMWRRNRPVLQRDAVSRQLELKREVFLELLDETDWTLAWIVFKSLDEISHWRYDEDPDGRVAELLVELDAIFGALRARAGPDANVLLLSDHGFRRYRWLFNLDAWLMDEALAVRSASPPPERTLRPGTLAAGKPLEHERHLTAFDLANSRALPAAAEGHFGGIRLNLAGREPHGAVPAGSRAQALDEVRRRLEAARTPEGGPLVKQIFVGPELYPGPYDGRLPDLLFELDPAFSVISMPGGEVFAEGRTVNHDRVGILAGAGPDVARRAARGDASILDVGPTALHLLGLPVYDDVDGRVLVEWVAGGRAPRRVAEADDPPDLPAFERFAREAAALSAEQDADLRARLRALGYLD